MDGVILINKPQGFTSFDVVAKVRGILHIKKVGHAGTLDPLATGVLPVFVGRATKCCDIMPVGDKRYVTSLKLGLITDTQDITGTVISTSDVKVDENDFKDAVKSFEGEYDQLPPMYSAVKIGGKRLYELARKGIEIERQPKRITMHSIDILNMDTENNSYTLDVFCSKGSYIRTLCHDIGEKLGCGAVMQTLCRTEAGGFSLDECITMEKLEELRDAGELEKIVLPVERIFISLPKVQLNQKQRKMFLNGVKLTSSRVATPDSTKGRLTVYYQDEFLGTAFIKDDELIMEKLFLLEV